jgi:polar amino acid transport system substrate-binding protein
MKKFLFILTTFTSWLVLADDIRVVTEHLPPYQIAEKGRVVGGSSYLIMKEVLKRANIKDISEVMPWARAYEMGLSRENTIIYSITRSPERELLFHWIGQLHNMEYSFFSSKKNQRLNIETTKDALNYRAVAVRNSFEANSLKRIGFIEGKNLILVVDYITAWKMLKVGRADITYANAPILEFPNMNGSLFKRQGVVIETFQLYVAANINTDKKTIDNLSAALQSVKADPSFKNLFSLNTNE